MNGQSEAQWKSISIVTVVLCVVLVWWVWIVPRTPQFKRYKRKTEIRARLYNVEPPRGVRVANVDAIELPSKQWMAFGTYSGLVECDAVIAHYKEQFPKQGFKLTEEKQDAQKQEKNLTFLASDYQAILSCTGRELPQPYMIWIFPKEFHNVEDHR
jgi:uncharacterized protein (DUF3820 family)